MQKAMKVTGKNMITGRNPVSLMSKILFHQCNVILQYPRWNHVKSNKTSNACSYEDIVAVEKELFGNEDTSFLMFNRSDPRSDFLCSNKPIQSTAVLELPYFTLTRGKWFGLVKRESGSVIIEDKYKSLPKKWLRKRPFKGGEEMDNKPNKIPSSISIERDSLINLNISQGRGKEKT